MDWLRRNWPDLLIGIALVAVIAGIIATLISGGSFFPFGGNRNTGTTTGQTSGQTTTVTTPLTPSGSTTTTPSGSTGSTTTTTPSTTSGSSTTTPGSTTTQPGGSSISVLPPTGSTSGTETPSTTTTPATSGSTTGSTDTSTPSTSTLSTTPSTTTTTPSTTSGSSTTSSTTSSTISTPAAAQGAPYRVSVGAFGSVDNANRQADAFRAAGYPVFLGTQGSLNIVLVGPYDTEAQARSVADRIRADASLNVSDPTVYMLDGADSTTTSTPATTSTPSTTVTTPATTPATTQPTSSDSISTASTSTAAPATSATGRYLQVGAYGSRDSSLPQRERVEGLGFVVSEREESGLIKLLIGPFDSSGLEQAQARLTAAGVESFAR